jgi:hypothetical protein
MYEPGSNLRLFFLSEPEIGAALPTILKLNFAKMVSARYF